MPFIGGRRFTGGEAWRFRVEAGEDAGGAVSEGHTSGMWLTPPSWTSAARYSFRHELPEGVQVRLKDE